MSASSSKAIRGKRTLRRVTAVAPEILWTPSEERIERATLTRYTEWLASERGLRFESYQELWRWSIDELETFWGTIAEFCDVRFSTEPKAVLGSSAMPGAEWFVGGRLNYAEHIFRDRDPSGLAIQHASELRSLESVTWGELMRQAAAVAAGLRSLGVGQGDRVAAYMPNIPE